MGEFIKVAKDLDVCWIADSGQHLELMDKNDCFDRESPDIPEEEFDDVCKENNESTSQHKDAKDDADDYNCSISSSAYDNADDGNANDVNNHVDNAECF